MTAPRRPRSAWLLVGSTPSTRVKVQSAGQRLSRLVAKRRWYVVGPAAVGAGDAGEVLAEQRPDLALVPVGGVSEDRCAGGERAPERALAAAQAPAGLVDPARTSNKEAAIVLSRLEGEILILKKRRFRLVLKPFLGERTGEVSACSIFGRRSGGGFCSGEVRSGVFGGSWGWCVYGVLSGGLECEGEASSSTSEARS
jgi:hypothetical protein